MEGQNVAVRLKHFMDYAELTNSQFADLCAIPRPSLSQLLSGRNKKLSDVVVKQIHDKFPELSVLWLMFGEGDMLVPKPVDPALLSEAAKFMDDDTEIHSNANLRDLNQPVNKVTSSDNKDVSTGFANANLSLKVESNKQIPRKVRSITVFYDDNSYETFIPEKK